MLFKDEYPGEHSYFREAILEMLQSQDTDDEDRPVLRRAVAKLDEVSVFRKCPCGEPGCATFSFVDYQKTNYKGSIGIETSRPGIIVMDVDADGNLIGLEKVPTN